MMAMWEWGAALAGQGNRVTHTCSERPLGVTWTARPFAGLNRGGEAFADTWPLDLLLTEITSVNGRPSSSPGESSYNLSAAELW